MLFALTDDEIDLRSLIDGGAGRRGLADDLTLFDRIAERLSDRSGIQSGSSKSGRGIRLGLADHIGDRDLLFALADDEIDGRTIEDNFSGSGILADDTTLWDGIAERLIDRSGTQTGSSEFGCGFRLGLAGHTRHLNTLEVVDDRIVFICIINARFWILTGHAIHSNSAAENRISRCADKVDGTESRIRIAGCHVGQIRYGNQRRSRKRSRRRHDERRQRQQNCQDKYSKTLHNNPVSSEVPARPKCGTLHTDSSL